MKILKSINLGTTRTGNKKNKGITLIALVITIIIILILAGITIIQLTGSGLFGKTEITKKRTRYASAKEIVNLKLMEIQIDCVEKNEEYNIIKIAEGMELAEDITIEKYYNKETSSIKDGVSKNITNLEGIVVSVNKYSEYKFLLGEECQIIGVLIGEVTNTTSKKDFTEILEFENGAIEDDKKINDEALVDYWPLNGTLDNIKANGHGSMYSDKQIIYGNGGAYLENNYLVANINQNHTSEWTLTCEYMPVTNYVNNAWILGWFNALDNEGSYCGLLYANNSLWLPNITNYGSAIDLDKLNQNQYNTIVLAYDKTYINCYINGEYCGKGNGVIKNYENMSVGGCSLANSFTGGYYKNIAYYERQLTETEISEGR